MGPDPIWPLSLYEGTRTQTHTAGQTREDEGRIRLSTCQGERPRRPNPHFDLRLTASRTAREQATGSRWAVVLFSFPRTLVWSSWDSMLQAGLELLWVDSVIVLFFPKSYPNFLYQGSMILGAAMEKIKQQNVLVGLVSSVAS